MAESKPVPSTTKAPWKKRLVLAGEVALVVWVLGIFYYFYQKQGFFELIQQVLDGAL